MESVVADIDTKYRYCAFRLRDLFGCETRRTQFLRVLVSFRIGGRWTIKSSPMIKECTSNSWFFYLENCSSEGVSPGQSKRWDLFDVSWRADRPASMVIVAKSSIDALMFYTERAFPRKSNQEKTHSVIRMFHEVWPCETNRARKSHRKHLLRTAECDKLQRLPRGHRYRKRSRWSWIPDRKRITWWKLSGATSCHRSRRPGQW